MRRPAPLTPAAKCILVPSARDAGILRRVVFLHGFGVGGYRSFGGLQYIAPLKKVNLFAGPNNSGKSNVLRFIAHHLDAARKAALGSTVYRVEGWDAHMSSDRLPFLFALALDPSSEHVAHTLERIDKVVGDDLRQHVRALLRGQALTRGSDQLWFRYEPASDGKLLIADSLVRGALDDAPGPHSNWVSIARNITRYNGGDLIEAMAALLSELSASHIALPAVHVVEGIRRVEEDERVQGWGPTGANLVKELARLQNPAASRLGDRKKFDAVERFVQVVLDDSDVEINVPDERNTINVVKDGRTLPLESIGTGIHEVVILAAAAVIYERSIVCIEEPEIHLHPVLQRRLLRHLIAHTSNQYFIATHSAHMLDPSGTSIFRVQFDGETQITLASKPTDRWEICQDLGYQASDLLQSNCVIWVEGPSDRIYLNHWIRSVRDDLIEGVHYSVMFYGGRLLSHLTSLEEVDEFISLRKLNRNMGVIMDRDTTARGRPLTRTKQRIIAELDDSPGFVWVTEGREVENYVPPAVMKSALALLRAGAENEVQNGWYNRRLSNKLVQQVGKVRIARAVSERGAALSGRGDLGARIEQVIAFIEQANGTGEEESGHPEASID